MHGIMVGISDVVIKRYAIIQVIRKRIESRVRSQPSKDEELGEEEEQERGKRREKGKREKQDIHQQVHTIH